MLILGHPLPPAQGCVRAPDDGTPVEFVDSCSAAAAAPCSDGGGDMCLPRTPLCFWVCVTNTFNSSFSSMMPHLSSLSCSFISPPSLMANLCINRWPGVGDGWPLRWQEAPQKAGLHQGGGPPAGLPPRGPGGPRGGRWCSTIDHESAAARRAHEQLPESLLVRLCSPSSLWQLGQSGPGSCEGDL